MKNQFLKFILISIAALALFSCHSLKTEGAPENPAVDKYKSDFDGSIKTHSEALWKEGRETFRN